ncbi:MAG: hypothetical protein PWP60_698 [Candidatus Atribacteria bacterium]|jgi:nickel-dependent lactate racemase|uniref:Lactate racemase domain-containing protein n=1 Tax=Thermatribacter velox TaxID=3039681 RepID=A0ABZ2YC86_9BACT|nr:hypothetical protein [Candidatus Atribacteria bacterium]MDI3530849.1 hypothetical protein [Candidatus Atribacteria bacterium]
MLLFSREKPENNFNPHEFREILIEALQTYPASNKKILAIIPDATRTLPMKDIFEALIKHLLPRTRQLDFIIALGTHPPMTDQELRNHLGVTFKEAENLGTRVFNHHFQNPEELEKVGTISKEEVKEISGGLLEEEIPVTINRLVFNYDELLIIGPVFPHEVVGFSGGYKYLFPGISGAEIIDKYHWLAALITNPKTIGHKETPTRAILNRAATFINIPITALCLVMRGEEPCGLFLGDPQEAWSKAADLSSQVNIVWKERAFHTVLSIAPPMYNELWVGGKCMYKLEPVVADGGTLIIYAPHIKEISVTHGRYLKEIGYHVRDFFVKQWDKYYHYPWSVLAHSTHVKGIGKYIDGKEYPRIEVILATGIPREVCEKINLGYLDYRSIDISKYENREEEGILVVHRAGEMLYRLKDGSVPDIDKL